MVRPYFEGEGEPVRRNLPGFRRLWRYRLTSRALGSLEHYILGATRLGQDVPGMMIPWMYFDYLRSGLAFATARPDGL